MTEIVCTFAITNSEKVMEAMELPIGGPSTWEEALMDLEESEREIDAQQGTSWDVVKEMIAERIYSYAD